MIPSETYSGVTPTTIPGPLHVRNPFRSPFQSHSVDPLSSTIPNLLRIRDTLRNSRVHARPNIDQHFRDPPAIRSTIQSLSKTYSEGPIHLYPFRKLAPTLCISTGTWIPLISIVGLVPLPNRAPPTCSHPWIILGLSPGNCPILPIIISTRPRTYYKGTSHTLGIPKDNSIQSSTIRLLHFPPPLHSLGLGLRYLVDRLV